MWVCTSAPVKGGGGAAAVPVLLELSHGRCLGPCQRAAGTGCEAPGPPSGIKMGFHPVTTT